MLSNKTKKKLPAVVLKIKDPAVILLFACVAIYFIFGTYHISKFFTVDEQNWINERIVQYWQAIKHREWKETMINDKPGITLAYVSGSGLIWERHPDLYVWKAEKHVSEYNSEKIEWLGKIFRLPILIFNGLISLYLFWIIKKYSGDKWIALWSTVLILLSPILLGISQIVNPDSLLWVFTTASLFSFLAYLKHGENKLAALSGLFLGFSILTKYTAIILFPFFFVLLLYKYFSDFDLWKKSEQIKAKLARLFTIYFLVIATSVIIFALLMPAAIFGKIFFYQKSIAPIVSELKLMSIIVFSTAFILLADACFLKSRLAEIVFNFAKRSKKIWAKAVFLILASVFIFILINWITGQNLINLERIPFDARRDFDFVQLPYYQKATLEFYPVVFSLSPLVIIFLLYAWIKSLFKDLKYGDSIFLISVFILVYYAAVIKNDLLATIRYSIIIYPLLFFIASIGIYDFIRMINPHTMGLPARPAGRRTEYYGVGVNAKKFFSKPANFAATIFLIIACALSLWLISPFYFDYANSLLPQKYLITGSWGEGGYEAAQYLNSLPGAENLNIWADYAGICEFFKGKCLRVYEYDWNKYKINYYVLSRRGEILYGPDRPRWKNPLLVDAYKYYVRDNPVWSLYIDKRPANYLKVYKADN